MPHEPSGSCPVIQLKIDRYGPSRESVRPMAVARCRRQQSLRRVAHTGEPGHRAMLAHHSQGGGGDAA
jgi:hypothetical protein